MRSLFGSMRMRDEASELHTTIFRLYAEGRRMTKRVASQHGVTAPQMAAVALLASDGPMSLTELGERMHTGASTLTGIVDRMEALDLAARERSSEDRRVTRVALTQRGAALAARLSTTPGDVVREALRDLTSSERRELGRLLAKLSAAIDGAARKAGLAKGGGNGDE